MRKPEYNERYLSLVQKPDPRQATLAKMRGKLAGGSQWEVRGTEKKRATSRAMAFRWGRVIGLAALIAAGNAWYFSLREGAPMALAAKRAATLPPPPVALDANDQALYWAFALYDFDRLKERFGTQPGVIVDASLAKHRLLGLLPKVDARTRFIIEEYQPSTRRDS